MSQIWAVGHVSCKRCKGCKTFSLETESQILQSAAVTFNHTHYIFPHATMLFCILTDIAAVTQESLYGAWTSVSR